MHPKFAELMPGEIVRLVQPIEPDLVGPLLAALQCALAREPAPPALLEAVIRAASSHRVPVYECATSVLEELAAVDGAARDAVALMSGSKDSRVRHNAVLCVGAEQPATFVQAILAGALQDKSSRVRTKAADWIGRLDFVPALPALATALLKEEHAGTREVLEWAVKRLHANVETAA